MTQYPRRLLGSVPIWRTSPVGVTYRFKDAAGVPVDLGTYGSGWTAQLKQYGRPAFVPLDFAVDTTYLSDPTDPRVRISLTGDQTAGLGDGLGVYNTILTVTGGGGDDPFYLLVQVFDVDGPDA